MKHSGLLIVGRVIAGHPVGKKEGFFSPEIYRQLRKEISPELYKHCQETARTAVRLAVRYSVDGQKAWLAGMLHDYAREWSFPKLREYIRRNRLPIPSAGGKIAGLLHAYVGADAALRRWGITDSGVRNAIRRHTIGAVRMTRLDKIIYVADYIEPTRKLPRVKEIRRLAGKDLDQALLLVLKQKMLYLIKKGVSIFPYTLKVWNYYQEKGGHKTKEVFLPFVRVGR